MPPVQSPPFNVDFIDKNTKRISEPWKAFLLQAQKAIDVGAAPSDAQFLIATANSNLTNPRNLGLLASGYLTIAVALGIATPSTTAAIPVVDLSGSVSVPNGGTGAATLTNHAALLGQGTAAVAFAAPGAAGQLLASNGAAADPSFQHPPFLLAPPSTTLAVAGNAITPTRRVHHCGAGLIKTITVPATLTNPDVLHLIPDAAFTYDATGNIGAVIGGLAVIGRTMDFTWDGAKWWASY